MILPNYQSMQDSLSTNNKFHIRYKFKNSGKVVISSSISNEFCIDHDGSVKGAAVGVEGKQNPQNMELLVSSFQQQKIQSGRLILRANLGAQFLNTTPSRVWVWPH